MNIMFRAQHRTVIMQFFMHKSRFYATEATIKTVPFRLHRIETGPSPEIVLKKEEALTIYEQMATIRKMEMAISTLYKKQSVRGFCHLYAGMEAVAVGMFASMGPQDSAITSYRNHAWTYLFGGSVDSILFELVGAKSGCAGGKGGSMHLYADRFYGGNAIVGAQVPVGVGIALGYKYRNIPAVSLAIYGDGAANNGQVFEAFNMAKLWNLPCIFLCENNIYSMGTSVARSTANPDFYKKGDVIPGLWVDGMDVISVKEAARFAFDYARSGKGPIVLEGYTYRYFGHSLSDPGTSYRNHDEIQEVRHTRDPIMTFEKKILAAQLVTADEIKVLNNKIKSAIDASTKKAVKEKPAETAELTYDIYSNALTKEVRGVSPHSKWEHKNVRPKTKSH